MKNKMEIWNKSKIRIIPVIDEKGKTKEYSKYPNNKRDNILASKIHEAIMNNHNLINDLDQNDKYYYQYKFYYQICINDFNNLPIIREKTVFTSFQIEDILKNVLSSCEENKIKFMKSLLSPCQFFEYFAASNMYEKFGEFASYYLNKNFFDFCCEKYLKNKNILFEVVKFCSKQINYSLFNYVYNSHDEIIISMFLENFLSCIYNEDRFTLSKNIGHFISLSQSFNKHRFPNSYLFLESDVFIIFSNFCKNKIEKCNKIIANSEELNDNLYEADIIKKICVDFINKINTLFDWKNTPLDEKVSLYLKLKENKYIKFYFLYDGINRIMPDFIEKDDIFEKVFSKINGFDNYLVNSYFNHSWELYSFVNYTNFQVLDNTLKEHEEKIKKIKSYYENKMDEKIKLEKKKIKDTFFTKNII